MVSYPLNYVWLDSNQNLSSYAHGTISSYMLVPNKLNKILKCAT